MKNLKNYNSQGTDPAAGSQNYMTDDRNGPSEDDILISRCRKGNMTAFGQLVEKYQHRLFNTIYRMVNNYDDALELTQEAFYRAIKGLKKFRGNCGFYTWLFRIGINLSISHRSRQQKIKFTSVHSENERFGHQADGLMAVMESKDDNSPARAAQLNEAHDKIIAAIEQLEPDARAAVILRDVEQLDYSQIALVLEVPVGTVKSRLCRARMKLRERLLDI